MKNKTKSTAYDVIITFGTKIIVLFGSFIVSIILARLLGPEGKGIVTAIFVVPNILMTAADLGIRQASAFYIGRGYYSTKEILSSLLSLWVITSLLTLSVAAIYYSFGSAQNYGWGLISIALMTIPLNLLFKYFRGVLQGNQKIGSINVSEIVKFAINLSGVIILVALLDLGVYGAALVHLLVAFSVVIYSISVIKQISPVRFAFNTKLLMLLFSRGITFALALFILTLNYRVDIIFLEHMTDAEQVGIYSVGVTLSELIWQLPAAIALVLFSRSANSKDAESASNRAIKLLRFSFNALLIFCLFFWLMAPLAVTIVYGDAFFEAGSVIRFLLPGVLAMVIVKILHPDMAARGYPLYSFWIFLAVFILNVILNFMFIPQYGYIGAAITSTVTYIIGSVCFLIAYIKKESIQFRDTLFLKRADLVDVINIVKKLKKRWT
ncbi:flippase [Salicibibacter halophilus]|uniref:Flippase n=1 Tax=Salicibibacter halophilus TaxID=2502791 RepID=A0A514LF69_9BACI|nr:flippase [Salicibibacter halophilus]QDI90463.1 flippase [Salicibibacter halophilus]